jgi:hypothetical protein
VRARSQHTVRRVAASPPSSVTRFSPGWSRTATSPVRTPRPVDRNRGCQPSLCDHAG